MKHLRPLPALHSPANTSPPLPGTPVKSKNIRTIAYDPQHQTLQVQFHSGDTYDYLNVPPVVHRGLMDAHSKSDFLRTGIATRFRAVKRAVEPYVP